MAKRIDLNKTVYELTKDYPELIDIMAALGFKEVTKKAMLNSMGKIMTLPKGLKIKNIPMDKIISALKENGFEVVGTPVEIQETVEEKVIAPVQNKARLVNYC